MAIRRLKVSQIRNIISASLELSSHINLICGPNGSGKTSLLEAAFMLSRGRSFRNNKYRTLINDQHDSCTVFAEVSLQHADSVIPVGVHRKHDGTQLIKINSKPVTRIAELAELIAVQVINPDTLAILEGGPQVRRQFVDWGVFHVEHNFLWHWQCVNRALKQRNGMLRRGNIDPSLLQSWDKALVEHAEQLQQLRKSYVEQLKPLFQASLQSLSDMDVPTLSLAAGWDEKLGLAEMLGSSLEQDKKAGFTQYGPHRSDLRVRLGNRKVADILSRGQQKLVVSSLKLAQAALFSARKNQQSIFLVDDLAAELDGEHRERLFNALVDTGAQLLVTSIDNDYSAKANCQVFHVKHGQVTTAN